MFMTRRNGNGRCGGFIGLIVIGLIIYSFFSSSDNNTSKSTSTQRAQPSAKITMQQQIDNAVHVTAVQLHNDYEANEIAANQKYKGKEIVISGIIIDFSKGILGHPQVRLETGLFSGVWIDLEKSQGSIAATLSKGQPINFLGVCRQGPSSLVATIDNGIILQ